jgi:3-deoxy-D-manno-octulosonic-acid transferase
MGNVPSIRNGKRAVIWIHCVSVGETQAARPLVAELKRRLPKCAIVISTTTVTGQNLARDLFNGVAAVVFYFPFDWRWAVRKTLRRINPGVVLLMETEIWPSFLRECAEQGIPVAIVNGRLSEQSSRRYRLIKGFMSRTLRLIRLALMQTEADKQRLLSLGMDPAKTFVSGSLKFDVSAPSSNNEVAADLSNRFAMHDSLLIVAASTHAPEEQIVLDTFRRLASEWSTLRLIIVPRHPERFDEVERLIEASGFPSARRTSPPSAEDQKAEVVLLDTIGELQSIYSLATVVFVGGSISNTGGHNVLEPAAVGACIVTGAHTFNFQSIVESFVDGDALIQLPPLNDANAATELANTLSDLLSKPEKRHQLGERARKIVVENRGATERTIGYLSAILPTDAKALTNTSSVPTHHQ